MFTRIKKIFLASLVLLTVLATGAWQSTPAPAESQIPDQPEIPLYPGLTWSSLGLTTQNIKTNIKGDTVSLSGERFEAQEQFIAGLPLPQDILSYYSNEQLAQSGWTSYDTSEGFNGVENVFSHDSGVYLSIEYFNCPDAPSRICIAVWMSEQANQIAATPAISSDQSESATASTFGKKSPANGSTNLNPASVTLSWSAYSPTPDKYSYCVQAGSACAENDPDWTSTYNTSVTITNLAYNTTYYWQVRAVTCVTCTPKKFVYADNGSSWTFKTKTNTQVVILGNAGVAGAILSYIDGTAKSVSSDSTGAYSITLPYNWSGTITPSKPGYIFTPKSASFTNLTAPQTILNFAAGLARQISGNAGAAYVTLGYVDGIFQSVLSDSSGNYSIVVPSGWNGSVIPSHGCYTFSPPNRSYSNLTADQTGQNFTPSPVSGCADISVSIKGTNQGRYGLVANTTIKGQYPNVINGPVKVMSTNAQPIITSQRAFYQNSFNELMGYPANKISTEYWFPWYDQVYMQTWILVANPSSSQTAYVDIYIGGVKQGSTRSIDPNSNITPQFPGVLDGPVRVVSVTGPGTASPIKVFASERSLYGTSFNELIGYPDDQLTIEYWFPWYDQIYMNSWVLVGNPSSSQTAYVDIYIGGVKQGSTRSIDPNSNITPQFPGVLDGPVRVVSVTGPGTASPIKVFASERSLYGTSFNEVMGSPNDQLTTDYYFPWYDNQAMQTWVLVGNPSSSQTAYVDIYIGGVKQGATRSIDPNSNITPQFSLVSGPVKVVSVTGAGTASPIKVFASERTLYGPSFNEMMGYPGNQLTTEYWFTWYDNVYMKTDVYMSYP